MNVPGHLRTMNVSLPSELNCRSMFACITRIAVITTMMENTPTNTPRSVKAERSLCAATAPKAIRQLSRTSEIKEIWCLFIAKSIHWIHARRPPRGEKAGQHTRHRRDEQRKTDDAGRHFRRHGFFQQQRRRPRDHQGDDAADEADARRFDQKLQQDGAVF